MLFKVIAIQIAFSGLITCQAVAGPFVNLDLEMATIPPTPPNQLGPFNPVDTRQAFPGWTAGSSYTVYNNLTLSTPAQVLIGPNFPNGLGVRSIQGNYSALIWHGRNSSLPPAIATPFLRQTAMVPADARSLSFLVDMTSFNGLVPGLIMLNGAPAELVPIASPGLPGIGARRMAVDVSAHAGKDMELTITSPTYGSAFYFDDVRFSTQPLPELDKAGPWR